LDAATAFLLCRLSIIAESPNSRKSSATKLSQRIGQIMIGTTEEENAESGKRTRFLVGTAILGV
jgi:hypothetical protein